MSVRKLATGGVLVGAALASGESVEALDPDLCSVAFNICTYEFSGEPGFDSCGVTTGTFSCQTYQPDGPTIYTDTCIFDEIVTEAHCIGNEGR